MQSTPAAEDNERRIEFARSSTDRMLLGVCGGAARRFGVDAYVVRLALLLLTLTGGLGVLLYAVGWALSRPPDEVPPPKPLDQRLVSTRTVATAAARAAC